MDTSEDRVNQLEDHLRKSMDSATRESVSDHSFYSYRHANRLFSANWGESIHSYLNKLRIQRALEYLIYTPMKISEIAFAVGYESSSSFSKAFKKHWKQSPTAYRKEKKIQSLISDNSVKEKNFTIEYLDKSNILTKKVSIASDATAEHFFDTIKSNIPNLESETAKWMLFWDEDPLLTQVSESRFFIGIDSGETSDLKHADSSLELKGQFAIFESDAFGNQPYQYWHHIAYVILDLSGMALRDDYYIEWFSSAKLASIPDFKPERIAVPVL